MISVFRASMTLLDKLLQLMAVNATLEESCMAFWFLQRRPTDHWHFRLMIDSLWRSFPEVAMHRDHLAILVPLSISVSVNGASQVAIPSPWQTGFAAPTQPPSALKMNTVAAKYCRRQNRFANRLRSPGNARVHVHTSLILSAGSAL